MSVACRRVPLGLPGPVSVGMMSEVVARRGSVTVAAVRLDAVSGRARVRVRGLEGDREGISEGERLRARLGVALLRLESVASAEQAGVHLQVRTDPTRPLPTRVGGVGSTMGRRQGPMGHALQPTPGSPGRLMPLSFTPTLPPNRDPTALGHSDFPRRFVGFP